MDQLAVIGNPIEHSLSPLIHAQFAKQTGHQLEYKKIKAELDEFEAVVKSFQHHAGKGMNVTLPFKQRAFLMADQTSPRAQQAGAANTLHFLADGTIFADNTDGVGLVRDLTINHQVSLTDQVILILGAGGAVCGVLGPLLAAKPAAIIIANRTKAKAEQLAQRFTHQGNVMAVALTELHTIRQPIHCIINAISAGLAGDTVTLPQAFIQPTTICYDMLYSKTTTPFLQMTTAAGSLHNIDGLGMLLEQAAESFFIWYGLRPDTQPARALLTS